MSETVKAKLQEVYAIALDIELNTSHDTFISLWGHVNELDIKIYENGWCKEKDETETYRISYDRDRYEDGRITSELNEVIENLKKWRGKNE